MRFVQFSDVHLDASLRESKLAMPEEKRQQRQREIRQIVADACSLAREKDCDLILIPGDLFDEESADLDTIRFLIETFGSVAPLPIFIAPGNHDPHVPQSPYNPDFLAEKRAPPWPENVHIFSADTFQTVHLPRRADVAVTGISNMGRQTEEKRILRQQIPLPPAAFHLALFHGSREPFPPGKEATMPFRDEELLSQPFHYAAIGHYHTYAGIKDNDGRIRGAYSGTPASQKLNEVGEKFVLLGEIAEHPAKGEVTLERIKLDRRTLHAKRIDCSGCTYREAVIRRIEEEARKVSQNKDDILFIRLEGRFPSGAALDLPANLLQDEYFHVAMDPGGLRPDYDFDKYLHEPELMRSVEGEFFRTIKNRGVQTKDEEEKRILRAALYYGLDALTEGRICGRYEE
jgi:DNA repair exonuclease SbcCD nuclease subunit